VTKINYLFILFISFALGGCTHIFSKHPVGVAPVKIAATAWDGVWTLGDALVIIKVTDETSGKMNLGIIEEKEDKFKISNTKAFIRKYKDETYINIHSADWFADDKKGRLKKHALFKDSVSWYRLLKQEDAIILWIVDQDAFYKDAKINGLNFKILEPDLYLIDEPSEVTSEYLEKHKQTIYNGENDLIILTRKIKD